MKAQSTIELLNLFQSLAPNADRKAAEELVQVLAEETPNHDELKQIYLTKDDMITIVSKIDSAKNSIIGWVIAVGSLIIAIVKLT